MPKEYTPAFELFPAIAVPGFPISKSDGKLYL